MLSLSNHVMCAPVTEVIYGGGGAYYGIVVSYFFSVFSVCQQVTEILAGKRHTLYALQRP